MLKRLVLMIPLVGVALMACNQTMIETSTTDQSQYPEVPPAYTGLPAVRPKTKVLTQFAAAGVTDYQANGVITYNASRPVPVRTQSLGEVKTDEPEEVVIGTILVSPPTEAAPYGFLGNGSR